MKRSREKPHKPAATPPDPAPRKRRAPGAGWPEWVRRLAPALLYFAITLYFCAGIVLRPLSHITFFVGDAFLNFWNYWWVRQSLLELHTSPFATTYLTYPHQASLVFHAHDFLHGLLTLPLQLAVPGTAGLILSINVVVFACYFLSALAAYAAIHLITGQRLAALIAGFGYAFSAFHQTWASMPVIAATYWIPLFTWLFLRAMRRGGRLALVLPGLCFALCSFQSLYYTLFLALLWAGLSALMLFTEPAGAMRRRHLLAIALAVAIGALPMGALAVRDIMRTRYATTGTQAVDAPKNIDDDCRNSVDLAALIIPGPQQGLWRGVAEPWNAYLRRPSPCMETFGLNGEGGRLAYVGLVPLLLAALAWRAPARRMVAGWTLGALAFAGLALGPHLHVYGTIFRDWWLPLPYRALLIAPQSIAKIFHAPAYFWALASFAIWTLAAFGLGAVLAVRRSPLGRAKLGVLLALWLLVDHAAWPLETWPLNVSPAYRKIAADPRPAAVLQFPAENFLQLEKYNLLQTIHHKPIARGFLSRMNPAALRRDQMIRGAYTSMDTFNELLVELGPTYIVIERQFLTTTQQRIFASALRKNLTDSTVYDDGHVMIYAWGMPPPASGRPGR